MKAKAFEMMFLLLILLFGRELYGQGISELTDEEGRIFLTDKNGALWRCYATGTGSLPLQCRKAGKEDGEKIAVENIESHFVEDVKGNKYPVRY